MSLLDSSLFNEAIADRMVAININKYKEKRAMNIMLFKDKDGVIQQVTDFNEITDEDIVKKVKYHQAELIKWQNALNTYRTIAGTTENAPTEPAAQAETTPPAEQPTPAQPADTPTIGQEQQLINEPQPVTEAAVERLDEIQPQSAAAIPQEPEVIIQ